MGEFGCTACRACEKICNSNCINVEFSKGIYYPKINLMQCKQCRQCEYVCSERNPVDLQEPIACYAAYISDPTLRLNSSSGGIATALMSTGLKNSMHVFASRMIDTRVFAEEVTEETINKFKGSQYVESDISSIFEKIVAYIKDKQKVLFIGLPCQVSAIKKYLSVKCQLEWKDNLITVDIVCHGVVPYEYFENHMKTISRNRKYDMISMRSNNARYNYAFTLWNGGKPVYSRKRSFSPYIYGFIHNVTLKEKCYSCRYSTHLRVGDISIGDFIGLSTGNIRKKFKNPSVVLVNSYTGEIAFKLLQKTAESLVIEEHAVEECVKGGPSFRHPAKRNPNRATFLQLYSEQGFDYAMKISCKKEIKIAQIKEVYGMLKAIIRKVAKFERGTNSD